MDVTSSLNDFLTGCWVDPAVFELRPDYRAMLLVVDGFTAEASLQSGGESVIQLVAAAEMHARELLDRNPAEEAPHIASWREAYRAFGAKPQRTRNSLEALTRRAEKGLPRVNTLTDVYNAISVLHQVPIGGEDFHRYDGPARLVRAEGDEPFDAVASGEVEIEYPEVGEVVWRDDAGVTCRRWNWRQGRRTGLGDDTRTAFFILDALGSMTDEALHAAADELVDALRGLGAELTVAKRMIGAS